MNKKSRTSLFLMEMIISVLLFCVTSAVCMQLFVQAHLKQQETQKLQFATIHSQTVAEIMQSCDTTNMNDILHQIQIIYPFTQQKTDQFIIGFDETFTHCEITNSNSYQILISLDIKNQMLVSSITVFDNSNNNDIYNLEVQKYIRNLLISGGSINEE